MNNDFIQNAVNNLYQANELMALKAENARLQAEVERLDTGIQPAGSNDAVGRAVNVLLEKEKEIALLQAEVERLRAASFVTAVPVEQYERLRKAGDDMAKNLTHIGWNICVDAWKAAKEGKPTE